MSDFIIDFGVLPGPLTYEEYVGLEMNRERARLRRVYFQGLGHTLAAGTGDLPAEVVQAACDTDEAAKRLLFEINAARNAKKQGY